MVIAEIAEECTQWSTVISWRKASEAANEDSLQASLQVIWWAFSKALLPGTVNKKWFSFSVTLLIKSHHLWKHIFLVDIFSFYRGFGIYYLQALSNYRSLLQVLTRLGKRTWRIQDTMYIVWFEKVWKKAIAFHINSKTTVKILYYRKRNVDSSLTIELPLGTTVANIQRK